MSDEIKVTDKRGQNKNEESATTQHAGAGEPDIGFSNLILSLGTSAMIHLGVIEDPQTKKKDKNLAMAKQEIDLIVMLEEKTKGNLTNSEKDVLEKVLYELRLRFVEASK